MVRVCGVTSSTAHIRTHSPGGCRCQHALEDNAPHKKPVSPLAIERGVLGAQHGCGNVVVSASCDVPVSLPSYCPHLSLLTSPPSDSQPLLHVRQNPSSSSRTREEGRCSQQQQGLSCKTTCLWSWHSTRQPLLLLAATTLVPVCRPLPQAPTKHIAARAEATIVT
jgi:hypothetical protein